MQCNITKAKAVAFAIGVLLATLVQGETWSLISNNSNGTIVWNNLQYWSSVEGGTNGVAGVVPSPFDDFVIIGGKRLRSGNKNNYGDKTGAMNFGGNSLQLGDASTEGALWIDAHTTARFDHDGLILKKGALCFSSYNTHGEPWCVDGKVTVQALASSPFSIFTDDGNNRMSNVTVVVAAALVGETGTGIRIGGASSAHAPQVTFVFSNPSGYKGSVVVGDGRYANNGEIWGSMALFGAMSGVDAITVESGGCFGANDTDAEISAANVSFESGARLQVNVRGSMVKATTSLAVAAGTQICLGNTFNGSEPIIRWPILQGPANSAFSEASFDVVRLNSCENGNVGLEVVTDNVAGTKTLYVSMKSMVTQILSLPNEGIKERGNSSMTNRLSWSDGELPHTEADYYTKTKLSTPVMLDSRFTFQGDSLTLDSGSTFAVFSKGLELPRLKLKGTSQILSGQGSLPYIVATGGIEVVGSPKLASWDSRRITLASEMTGTGDIRCLGITGSSSAPQGIYAFEGLNTNFFGTVSVSQSIKNDSYRPMLYLFDGRNLGGRLPEFNPRALSLADRACVCVTNEDRAVTMAGDLNRGVYINVCGGFYPNHSAAVIEVRQPILLNGKLQLEGAGRTVLAGEMTFEAADKTVSGLPRANSNLVDVAANATLVAANPGCLDGCAVTLNAGSKLVLRVDATDADLTRYGVRLAKTGSSLALDGSFGGTLPLELEAASEAPVRETTVGLVTVPTGSALEATLRAAIPTNLPRLWRKTRQRLTFIEDAQSGLTTAALVVEPVGMVVIVL